MRKEYLLPRLATGHLIAYRVWRVSKRYELQSWVFNATWVPGRALVAREFGMREVHEGFLLSRPTLWGIYALKSYGHVYDYHRSAARSTSDLVIFGRVALWGEVVEAERGYVAPYAYPIELIATRSQDRGSISLVAARYGCEFRGSC